MTPVYSNIYTFQVKSLNIIQTLNLNCHSISSACHASSDVWCQLFTHECWFLKIGSITTFFRSTGRKARWTYSYGTSSVRSSSTIPPSVFIRIFWNLAHMFPGLVPTKVLSHFLRFLPIGPETGKNGPN